MIRSSTSQVLSWPGVCAMYADCNVALLMCWEPGSHESLCGRIWWPSSSQRAVTSGEVLTNLLCNHRGARQLLVTTKGFRMPQNKLRLLVHALSTLEARNVEPLVEFHWFIAECGCVHSPSGVFRCFFCDGCNYSRRWACHFIHNGKVLDTAVKST